MTLALAVDMTLLTLAVMTVTVGALHQTRRPVTLVTMTVSVAISTMSMSVAVAVSGTGLGGLDGLEDDEDSHDERGEGEQGRGVSFRYMHTFFCGFAVKLFGVVLI